MVEGGGVNGFARCARCSRRSGGEWWRRRDAKQRGSLQLSPAANPSSSLKLPLFSLYVRHGSSDVRHGSGGRTLSWSALMRSVSGLGLEIRNMVAKGLVLVGHCCME
jgi:hypothetical protein